ncbi:MAG: TetR/AcrR family transcriptional regulator [bacterium]
MEEQKLTRKEREILRHRDQVLEVALELFSERGYYNVSMQEIAQKAEFAIGTLYKFFRNKEDLYKALIMDHVDKFHTALMKALEEGEDEYSKLMNFIRVKGELFMSHMRVIRLYFAEARGISFNVEAGLEAEIRKMHRDFLENLADVLRSGIKKGIFRKLDPKAMAISLDSLTNAFRFSWSDNAYGLPYEKNIQAIRDIFFKGISETGLFPK